MPFEEILIGTDTLAPDLTQYLWKHPRDLAMSKRNMENFDLLRTTYTRANFVSFTGAGVSKPLGVFDWDRLMEELHRIAKEKGFGEELPHKENYPEFAEKLYRYLNNKGQQSLYYELLKRRMSPHTNTSSLTLVYLTLSIETHLTTNFDRSIENAYSFLLYFADFFGINNRYEMPKRNYLKQLDIASQRPAIYYLHGSVAEGVYILRKSDYETFYPSLIDSNTACVSNLQDCLKYFYRNRNILFIGFSFQDPYVRRFFLKLAKDYEMEQRKMGEFYYSQNGKQIITKEINHFILMEENNQLVEQADKDFFTEMEEYRIYPIVYQTGEHVFLELLFKLFAEKNKGTME